MQDIQCKSKANNQIFKIWVVNFKVRFVFLNKIIIKLQKHDPMALKFDKGKED